MKYYTYKDVIAKIRDITRVIDIDAEAGRLERIIIQRAADRYPPSAYEVHWKIVQVENGLAEVPCDSIRVLRVMTTKHEKIGYRQDGVYIKPSHPHHELVIFYYALPKITVDGVEQVAILYDMIDYLAYEAIYCVILDGLQTGTINPNYYQIIERERDKAMYKLNASFRTVSIDAEENWLRALQSFTYYQNRGR